MSGSTGGTRSGRAGPASRWLPTAWSDRPLVPLLALAATVLVWKLGAYGLWESTEARYAEIAARMVRSGDWLVPRLNFVEHWTKPPFAYWATAAGLRLLGIGELGARIGLVAAAMGTIALVHRWAAEGDEASAGFYAGVALLTSPLFFALARSVTTDLYLTLWVWVAAWTARRGSERDTGRAWRVAAWVAVALAVLTKGPVALLWTVVPAVAWATWTGRWTRLGRLVEPWGIAAGAAVAVPWIAWAVARRPGLVDFWLGRQTADRLVAPFEGEADPVWAYAIVLVWAAGPWIVPAVAGLARRWREGGPRRPPWLAVHVVVPLVFLSLVPTKRANYLLPAVPALAIAAGSWWSRVAREASGRWVVVALAVVSAGVGGGLLVAARIADVPPPLAGLGVFLGPAFLLGAVVALLAARRRRADLAFAGLAVPILGLWVAGYAALARPSVERWFKVSRPLAAVAATRPERPIVAAWDWPRAFPFYLDERIVTVTSGGRTTRFEPDSSWTRWIHADEEALADPRFEGALFVVPRRWRERLEEKVGERLLVVAATRRHLLLADTTGGRR